MMRSLIIIMSILPCLLTNTVIQRKNWDIVMEMAITIIMVRQMISVKLGTILSMNIHSPFTLIFYNPMILIT